MFVTNESCWSLECFIHPSACMFRGSERTQKYILPPALYAYEIDLRPRTFQQLKYIFCSYIYRFNFLKSSSGLLLAVSRSDGYKFQVFWIHYSHGF
jgi:hypothetical protein